MFFSQYFIFALSVSFHHCSIHIHPSTTHGVLFFSRHSNFPLSESFHHCSISIHLPPTLYNFFHTVLQFSPVSIIPPWHHMHLPPSYMFLSRHSSLPLSVSFHHSTISIHLPATLYVFIPALQSSPVSIITPLLHTQSSIYHPRCIMFFSQYLRLPRQYHSTIALYTFIHLPPTVYCFSNGTPLFPCQYHSTIAPYPFIFHPRCIMFFIQYFSFSLSVSLHHSTISIYHPRCMFLSRHSRLPLSVSFHHSTISIHLQATLYVFTPALQSSPVSIIKTLLHTQSFIYHPCCKMFFSQYLRLPRQYHSTIALYTFIHLPPKVYCFSPGIPLFPFQYHSTIAPYPFIYHPNCIMIFSKYFNFHLSVSFDHCSISIHLPTTQYNVFLPALQFSPVSIFRPLLSTHSSIYRANCIMIFFPSTSFFPCQYHSTIAQYPSIYHQRSIMFYPSTSAFPCQYQSTIAPYSIINLPPTL